MGQLRQLNRGSELLPRPSVGLFEDDATGEVWLMRLHRHMRDEPPEYCPERLVSRGEAERIMAGDAVD